MENTSIRKWYFVTNVGAIPEKEGRRVCHQDYEVALFNLGDEYLAVDNRCPHKQGPLADGILSGKSVFCPLHNWKINLENGCALSGGVGQVKTYPVKIFQNKVYVAFEEGNFQKAPQKPLIEEACDQKDIN
jgi:nitrite reductase (NADH) small subunit